MQCVACAEELPSTGAARCGCGGAWVTDAAFSEMVQTMRPGRVVLPWAPATGVPRDCPQCGAGMMSVALAGVVLDRCTGHGIWFDADELQRVLQGAPKFPISEGSPRSLTESKLWFGDSASTRDDEREGLLGLLLNAVFGPTRR